MAESNVHKQLQDVVADRIRSAILEGDLKPGEWLRQERLAQEYGVSQMPVREALKKLAVDGLVEHAPYRGVRVIEFSPEDIADLFATRSFLEGLAARAAAARITDDEIAELKKIHTCMQAKLAPEDLSEYRDLNRKFHTLIFSASRRAYLVRTLAQLWTTFPSMLFGNYARTADSPLPERDADDIAEHARIIAALERHNSDEAEQALRQHIESSGRQLVAALRNDL
jgi:DNA-binding GntR family transcriptional regulator